MKRGHYKIRTRDEFAAICAAVNAAATLAEAAEALGLDRRTLSGLARNMRASGWAVKRFAAGVRPMPAPPTKRGRKPAARPPTATPGHDSPTTE